MTSEKSLLCKIVTPERSVFEGEVNSLILPGAEGKFGILYNHVSYLAILDVGIIELERAGGTEYFACGGGYAEVEDNEVTILVESAESSDELDRNEIEDELETAKSRLKETDLDDVEREEVQHDINHAKSRLKTIEKETS